MSGEAGYSCTACGFQLWRPIARLRVSSVGLYDDARYPGRCLIALDEHYDDVADVPERLMLAWLRDVRDVSAAVVESVRADRMNYAVLGNIEPHVHMHLVPRRWAADPAPGRSPWQTDRPADPLPEEVRSTIQRGIGDRVSVAMSRDPFSHERPPR